MPDALMNATAGNDRATLLAIVFADAVPDIHPQTSEVQTFYIETRGVYNWTKYRTSYHLDE